MSTVFTSNARTGQRLDSGICVTESAELDAIVKRAAKASTVLAASSRRRRADLLRALASALEEDRDVILAEADRETALGEHRLDSEHRRTTFQLRFFADVILDGGYVDATIDHPDPSAIPAPRPDLRRMGVPIGPVAVFSASNFPLAFSVPGGDTASALAAGNAVVVKAHSGHPLTSEAAATALRRGAVAAGFPQDVLSVVYGTRAGVELVQHPQIAAVGFTGSVSGGRMLFDLAQGRPEPIPFYGELGSLNTMVVTPNALIERSPRIAADLAISITQGMGQFCTKPGLVLVPQGEPGTVFTRQLVAAVTAVDGAAMLNDRIAAGWREEVTRLAGAPGVDVLVGDRQPVTRVPVPTVLAALGTDVLSQGPDTYLVECFGPSVFVVFYDSVRELHDLVSAAPASLTGSVQASAGPGQSDAVGAAAFRLLQTRVGRVLWNQYPTGVAVAWATQHGGPYPATTAPGSTSVGAAAITRFLRALAYQNTPEELLPEELRDGNPTGIPQRVDGMLRPRR